VVGVNDGTPFTELLCIQQELAWSPNGIHAQYMILDSPIGSTTDTAQQYVGVYSTQFQWGKITNGLDLGGLPIWIAGWSNPAATYCDPANAASWWFAGGKPWLIQTRPDTYDPDTAC
jgi:hypothetical protein